MNQRGSWRSLTGRDSGRGEMEYLLAIERQRIRKQCKFGEISKNVIILALD
jgi:hypothetical protein